jgi:hypothetical protein
MTARTSLPWLCALGFVPLVPNYGLRGEDGMRFWRNAEPYPGRYWDSAVQRRGLRYGV